MPRSVGGKILVFLLAIAGVVGVGWGGYAIYNSYKQERAAERADFRADLVAREFKPVWLDWVDEDGKSELEAVVVVGRACHIELDREDDEDTVITTINGRKIEVYTVDDYVTPGREEIQSLELGNRAIKPKELSDYVFGNKMFEGCRA